MAQLANKAIFEQNSQSTMETSQSLTETSLSTQEIVRENLKEPNVKEMSREQLEDEVTRLKQLLAKVKTKTQIIDPTSVLATRARFMELAGAEFNRTNRYGRDLTLILAKVSGYQRVLETSGPEAAEHVMSCVAEICTSATRVGVDILGRTEDSKIAMLLPETNLAGGEKCLARINKLVAAQPIKIGDEKVRVGMMFSARPLRKEHKSFEELLASA